MQIARLALLVAVVAACTPTEKKSGDPSATCTTAGAQCLYAPGKLGACVEKLEGCEAGRCLVCQSQH